MSATLLDSSIYIDALRQGDDGVLTMRRLGSDSFLWLSAVVLGSSYQTRESGLKRVRYRREFGRNMASRKLAGHG